jgi:N-acetylmuramoyl-L-alanine amidase
LENSAVKIILSSGHGKYIRGAAGPTPWGLDEVNEARRVVALVATILNGSGVPTKTYNDDVSTTQNENLNRIVDFHNAQVRDLDVSVHFNAYQATTSKPMGTECLYLTQSTLAADVASAIADSGHFLDRGAKKRTDLFFLNKTDAPSILIETCFVDSKPDADLYRKNFEAICTAIADAISGEETELPDVAPPPEAEVAGLYAVGKCSHFGGPDDDGVSADEGLAFIDDIEQMPQLFLPYQPEGTTGLARRLNPFIHYLACRWDYDETPREMLREQVALVRNNKTGMALKAFPADWGPHEDTGRVADLSPGLMDDLKLTTDDEVEIVFPYLEEVA